MSITSDSSLAESWEAASLSLSFAPSLMLVERVEQESETKRMALQIMKTPMVLAVLALALVSARHARIKTLAVLLVAVGLLASTAHLVHALLLLNPTAFTHSLVHVILEAMRVLRLHHGNGLFPFLLMPGVVAAVVARALHVAVLLTLEARAVQFQTSALAACTAGQGIPMARCARGAGCCTGLRGRWSG